MKLCARWLKYLWYKYYFGKIRYVPGTPGAPWTHQEVLIVKSKLYSIFSGRGGYDALKQIYGENPSTWMDVPNAAKMLRLGFHDCLKYKDGTGGCDGCLNWEGVGHRFVNFYLLIIPFLSWFELILPEICKVKWGRNWQVLFN